MVTLTMHIGDEAFRDSMLTSLDLPAGVAHIGDEAFRDSM